jgi:hypothetical protein
VSASATARAVPGDRRRLFLTGLLVYAVCLNPLLANPMTWSSLDAAVSFVDTGRWQVAHGALYGDMDVARAGDRPVLGPPPGLAVTLVPVYAAWRGVAGPVATREAFQALHVVATLMVAAVASALAAGEVAAVAGWLGASRRGRLWAAVLFAFGTPAFLFATRLFKENVAALVLIVAFRLAVTPGASGRRLAAGFLAGAAGLVAYPAGLLAPGLGLVVAARDGRRQLGAFALGALAPLAALATYNATLFGRPWRFAYASYINLPEAAASVGWQWPSASVLLNSLVHQREGLLLYSPFLLLGAWGLRLAWREGRRVEAAVTAGFALMLWLLSAAWLARFPTAFTGARYLFAAVPLLAAFAGPVLERLDTRLRWTLGGASVALTYLVVQAGHIPEPAALVYAVKTFVSGAALPVLLKETLPAWLGIETLHTTVARGDVSARDVLALVATPAGGRLALGQALVVTIGVGLFAGLALVLRAVWSPAPVALAPSAEPVAR